MLYALLSKYVLPYLFVSIGVLPALSYSSGDTYGQENCQKNFLPENSNKKEIELPSQVPEIVASNALVYASEPNFIVYQKEAKEQRPIASLTKLMTALVFLDQNPNWEDYYTITSEDNVAGGRVNLFLGDTISIKELFKTALIASDNGATVALVRSTGISEEEFILKMNEKAESLALFSTKFSDVTGLSDANVSTAFDLIRLAKVVFKNEHISSALSKNEYRYISKEGREKIITSTIETISDKKLIAGKTGYIESSGFNFLGHYINSDNREVFSVVLNSDTRHNRFIEAANLANWAFDNCYW